MLREAWPLWPLRAMLAYRPVEKILVAFWQPTMHGRPYSRATTAPENTTDILQQNSCNLTSDNPESLIIWHLRRVSQDRKFCFLPDKCYISDICRSQGHVQNGLRVSVHQPLWYLLTPCLLLHQLLQLWRIQKTHRTLMTLNHQMKEISKRNTLLIVVQPKYRSRNKKWLVKI
jgi:hypothetical protein